MGVGTGRKEKKKNITIVTIEIDSLPQSELSSVSLSNLLTLFPSLSVAAAVMIRSLQHH